MQQLNEKYLVQKWNNFQVSQSSCTWSWKMNANVYIYIFEKTGTFSNKHNFSHKAMLVTGWCNASQRMEVPTAEHHALKRIGNQRVDNLSSVCRVVFGRWYFLLLLLLQLVINYYFYMRLCWFYNQYADIRVI